MKKTAKQWKDFYRKEEFQKQYCDPAEKLGMECTSGRTSFRLWSPVAEEVQICFYKNGEDGRAFEIHPMQLQEHGIWNYETEQSLHGIYYDFLLKIEGEQVQSADPYAKACGVNGTSQHGGGFEKDGSCDAGNQIKRRKKKQSK